MLAVVFVSARPCWLVLEGIDYHYLRPDILTSFRGLLLLPWFCGWRRCLSCGR